MAAGESAYDVAKRQREKAERLQKSAALWEKGAEGEVAVARALEALPEGWVALHDLAWPGRQRANLDHVVVGPGGVFIVDAKNWSGRVEVRDQVLLQNGRTREQAVTSVVEAAIALQKVLPGAIPCRSVLCFVGEQPLAETSWNVLVCSTQNLTDVLTSQPAVLGPDDMRACVDAVRAGTARPPETSVAKAVSRRSKKRRRALVELLVGLTALAVFFGGYKTVTEWMGEQLSGGIVTNAPDKPTPTKHAKHKKQGKERQDKQQ